MWQNLLNRRLIQEGIKKPKKTGLSHVTRVPVELRLRDPGRNDSNIKTAPVILEGRMLLCDFTTTQLGLFASRPLRAGQELAITLEHPRRFYCTGKVVSCVQSPHESPIIQTQPFDYRVKIALQFHTPDELLAVLKYVKLLNRENRYE